MNKIRVSIIDYHNTIPFKYGLTQNPILVSKSEFLSHYPSQGIALLESDKIDIGILPIASIKNIANAKIISNYCIGSNNKVLSVCICSDKPKEEITKITLDYQSNTSNILAKIIVNEIWKITPEYKMGNEGYETMKDNSAKVIIGDRAIQLADNYTYTYDLVEEWNTAFGLPFVFACWVANKHIPEEYLTLFEESLEYGVNHIEEAIQSKNEIFNYNILEYLKYNLDFKLTDDKLQAMELFWEKAKKY